MADGWNEDDWTRVNTGLALLGWRHDDRVTNEDSMILLSLADKALDINEQGALDDEMLEALSMEVFDILGFYIMEVGERAMMVSGPYFDSCYLNPLIQLFDEAILAYYRGYHTAAFAVMLIGLERYLRTILDWSPSAKDPSFKELRMAIQKFPSSEYRDSADIILTGLYSRYDQLAPTQFYFNRHGLLHGLRNQLNVDRMNTCRMFALMDLLCAAETGKGTRYVYNAARFQYRHDVYEECVFYGREKKLMNRV